MQLSDVHNITLLYNKYVKSLYKFGMGMGVSHDACLDIIQDIFCNLIETNKTFETDSIKRYLFRSFINRHINIQKSRKNMTYSDISDLPFDIEVSLVENTTVEEEIFQEEEQQALKERIKFLLSLLTDRQRKAVYLRYMEEMEYKEIGKILDMNEESVRKLVFRGLEKIRKHAGKNSLHLLLIAIFQAIN